MFEKKVTDKANEVVLELLTRIDDTNDTEVAMNLSAAIQRLAWLIEIKQEEK